MARRPDRRFGRVYYIEQDVRSDGLVYLTMETVRGKRVRVRMHPAMLPRRPAR